MMRHPDFLVIGGGIMGLSIARELKSRFADARITLFEKEADCGWHASGRNSGVLHAGFYYSPDSLKARFTRTGNSMLTAYCEARSIPVNRCGKLVVAQNEGEHRALDVLLARGTANDIELHDITQREAKQIEPRVKTAKRAIFSPSTAVVDPMRVMQALRKDAEQEGLDIQCGVTFLAKRNRAILTSRGTSEAGYVVNAAGLHADTIARAFGFAERHRILPFKGLYLYAGAGAPALRINVYPVPDLRNPFLGVHFTVKADGGSKVGPTAIPALWREQYHGLQRFRLSEFKDIVVRQAGLLAAADWGFRQLAFEEIRKYSRRHLIARAARLLDGVKAAHYPTWGTPGIRAQLMDVTTGKLEMDFVLQGDRESMHVLNAVSPAFTCSLPFASYVVGRVRREIEGPGSQEEHVAGSERRETPALRGSNGPAERSPWQGRMTGTRTPLDR